MRACARVNEESSTSVGGLVFGGGFPAPILRSSRVCAGGFLLNISARDGSQRFALPLALRQAAARRVLTYVRRTRGGS